MTTNIRFLVALLPIVAVAALAQTPSPSEPPQVPRGSGTAFRTAGLQWLDGELHGVGAGYKARFDDGAWEYTPALGKRAPHNFPVRFVLAAVGRGTSLEPAVSGTRTHEGLRVTYEHGSVVERCDVRPDGVELSYVLASLPTGNGDLTLRIALATELRPAPCEHGVLLTADDFGGVSIGAVTGIDAAGQRVLGNVRVRDGVLELSLPAAFVDAAVLPLIVDPLVGTNFGLQNGGDSDLDPDVAYDESNDLYLVVWSRDFSATDSDIRGQRVSRAGATVGSLISITANATRREVTSSIGNVNLRDRFAVGYVWAYTLLIVADDVLLRTVDAATGAVSGELPIAVGQNNAQRDVDVGGEATTSEDDAIVVWSDNGTILCQQVNIDPAGVPTLSGSSVILHVMSTMGTITSYHRPSIAKTGGSVGRYMVAVQRVMISPFLFASDVVARIISRDLSVLAAFDATTTLLTGYPSVDGDGTNWVIAFEVGGSPDRDIHASAWSYDQNGWELNADSVAVEAEANDDERFPCVAWTGSGSCLIGYEDQQAANIWVPVVKSVDLFTCAICEGQQVLTPNDDRYGAVAICSTLPLLAGAEEEALIVFGAHAGGSPDIRARRFASEDGAYTNLGGGCGAVGTAYATCARVNHASFQLRLRDAGSTSPAWLVIGQDSLFLPCGTCVLRPSPYTGFVVPGIAGISGGHYGFAIAIPDIAELRGTNWYAQWILPVAGPQCGALGANLSNALRITIE